YGHMGLYGLGDHLRPAQPDLFLYGIGDIEPKRQFFLVFVKQSGHLGDHEAPDTVVQGPAYEFILVQHLEAVRIGDHTAHMDSHFLDFGLVLGPYVDENVLQFWGFLLGPVAGMDGRPSKNTLDDALFRMD